MDGEILRWTSLQTVTPTGGTTRWEAPELIEESEDGNIQRPTFSSDIYAIASVMYEVYIYIDTFLSSTGANTEVGRF